MKKFFVILIAIIALVISGIAYSSLLPVPTTLTSTDDTPDDLFGLNTQESSSSSMSSSEQILVAEVSELKDSDADSIAVVTSSSPKEIQEKTTAHDKGYLAYTDGIIGNGEPALLFFHASWCSECRQSDVDLKALYTSGVPTINTYRIDYDTSLDLKKRYGVTSQHTFVLIDGKGTAVKTLLGATSNELKTILIAQ